MKKIKYYFLLLALFTNAQAVNKTGTMAAKFLSTNIGSKAVAMGGAFTAISNDGSSMYWNPAGMTSIRKMEAVFLSSDWIAGITYNYAAFGLNLGQSGIIGLSMTSLSTPEDLVRTVEKPNGTGEYFDANDLAINLSYARRLTNKFSLGGNIKYIRQSIWHANANSVAADLGALFITPFNNIRLGASLSNYGSDIAWDIRDSLGVVVSSGGCQTFPGNCYLSNTTYDNWLCLSDGCYSITLYDMLGDGWSGGFYNLLGFDSLIYSSGTLSNGANMVINNIGIPNFSARILI